MFLQSLLHSPHALLSRYRRTKVKLAALSPAALTTGCEVREKNFELPRISKKTIFFAAMDRKAMSERLETFSNEKITLKCKTHLQNKKTTS